MTAYEVIELEQTDGLLRIRLNRPRAYNALSSALIGELGQAIKHAGEDDSVRCVAISGNGGNFSAGYDLPEFFKHFRDAPPQAIRDAIRGGNNVCWSIWKLRKPVIAAVDGYCLGGAFELAMACDFVFSTTNAKFGEPEVRLADAPPFLISPWVMGMRAAKNLLLTGDIIDSQQADRLGLLTAVCEPGELDAVVARMATKLSAFAAETWHLNKAGVNRCYEIMGFQAAVEMGMDMFMAANSNPSEFKKEFVERATRDGFSAALKWSQSRYQT